MNLFLKNKYSKWYFNIIENAKLIERNCYIERHHIIPKSLGGTNDLNNIVKLTAKEHYICHLLLTKMVEGKLKRSMCFALNAISNCRKNSHLKLTAKQYERVKIQYSNSRIGFNIPENIRQKISKTKKDKKLTELHKKAISLGRQKWLEHNTTSIETRQKHSKNHKGKVLSIETKIKIGLASKDRIQSGAKNWILQSPNGEIFKCFCLKRFCNEKHISWKPLSNNKDKTKIIKGLSKGWQVLSRF